MAQYVGDARKGWRSPGMITDLTWNMSIDTFVVEQQGFARRLPESKADSGWMSDKRLLNRLKKGDEQAWMLLLREWQGPLYRYFSYALPDPDLAGEALCATLEATIRAIPQFDGSQSLTIFLYSLAAQRVSMYSRKRKAGKRPPVSLGTRGQTDTFRAVLTMVPQRQRQALLLRYHLGLSVTEIANILGQTPTEIEQTLDRGSRQLRDALGSVGYQ